MKLIYLSEVRLPTKNAHGFQIMWMCEAFSKAGAEVELVVPYRINNLLKEEPFSFYGVERIFKVTKLPVIDLYPLRFVPEKISAVLLRFSFLLVARLYLLFVSFDILYTREPYAGVLFNDPVIEMHMPEHLQATSRRYRAFIAITSHIKKVLVEKGVAPEKVLVAPDAVDLSLYTPPKEKAEARVRLGLPKDAKIVLYWGNFKAWKGVDVFADAVKDLPDCFCLLVGGTKETDVARIKERLSAVDAVRVEGFVDHKDQPWYFAAADALILPNTKKDENSALYTSPLKLFEYMASGRPIVASDVPSLREILNESNALFFEADNPKDLAEKVTALFGDASLGQRLADNALRDVIPHTWMQRAERILAFISKKDS